MGLVSFGQVKLDSDKMSPTSRQILSNLEYVSVPIPDSMDSVTATIAVDSIMSGRLLVCLLPLGLETGT